MANFVMKLADEKENKDYYLMWSTIVDAPVTYGMELDEFKTFYRDKYGESEYRELEERLKRVEKNGISGHPPYDNFQDFFNYNRAGDNETLLDKEGVLEKYCRHRVVLNRENKILNDTHMNELQEFITWLKEQRFKAENDMNREAGFDRDESNLLSGMVRAFDLVIKNAESLLAKRLPIRTSYLVRFVQPKKLYPVEYTIRQDGTRNYGRTEILGADLTETQIVDLFIKELL